MFLYHEQSNDGDTIVNLFNKHFSSGYSSNDQSISQLKTKHYVGPDGVH